MTPSSLPRLLARNRAPAPVFAPVLVEEGAAARHGNKKAQLPTIGGTLNKHLLTAHTKSTRLMTAVRDKNVENIRKWLDAGMHLYVYTQHARNRILYAVH